MNTAGPVANISLAGAPDGVGHPFHDRSATGLERDRSWPARLLQALLALLSAVAGLALAAHYPVGPAPWLALPFVAAAAATYAWPSAWLVGLPALVPLVGFAPWTGWITFEELDLLVLAVAAGGYLRLARAARAPAAGPDAGGALTWLFAALFAASVGVSMLRGFADAGGFVFGWFQGYHGPMNSVRLAKSFFWALLLLPLWRAAHRRAPARASAWLAGGLALGLAGVALAALWERLAFTGLLDFSDDYRTTALFWEMNVGGAALDGFLALTVPFALRELWVARSSLRSILATALLLLASYACLTTFSRGVYLAVPVGVLVTIWLALRQRRSAAISPGDTVARPALHVEAASQGIASEPPAAGTHTTVDHGGSALWPAVGLALAFAVAATWMFPTSGYRGMLALLGAFALLMRLPGGPDRWRALDWASALAGGAVLVALSVLATRGLDKGAYLAYTAVLAVGLASSWPAPRVTWLPMAGFIGVLAGIALVALHWGGEAALVRAVPVIAVLAIAAVACVVVRRAPWPASLRWQAPMLGGLIALSALVGVLGGGAYMTSRFATSEDDLQGRIAHWREGVAMLRTPAQWLLGKGLGRYPANFVIEHSATDAPGDYALLGTPGSQHLALAGGKKPIGWGELLRVSQRVPPPRQPATVRLKARTTQAVTLHLEVCEKQLLYNARCLLKELPIKPTAGQWRAVQATLEGAGVSRGAWYAPRMLSFSIGNESTGTQIEVDDLELRDADGRNLLANGDFSDGMAHWFFSSDRNHLPWHIKNLFLNTLFDQGLLGLGLLGAMLLGALWRAAFGHARGHTLAPPIAGALAGFAVLGLFDSLLDVPRDAFVFYLLLLLALTLRSPRGAMWPAQPVPGLPRDYSRPPGAAMRQTRGAPAAAP